MTLSETEYIDDINNYYGTLEILKENGEYYWGIWCESRDMRYYKIHKSLYDELKKSFNS